MNCMKQVTEMLGLAWHEKNQESEEFNIVGNLETFKLTKNGLYYSRTEGLVDTWSYFLRCLLVGDSVIQKKPYEPKQGDGYYYADISSPDLFDTSTWTYCYIDKHRFELDLIRRTTSEAITKSKELLKIMEVQGDD